MSHLYHALCNLFSLKKNNYKEKRVGLYFTIVHEKKIIMIIKQKELLEHLIFIIDQISIFVEMFQK